MVRVILYIYVAVLLAACSKSESTPSGDGSSSGMVEVTISTSIDDGSTVSRAEEEEEAKTEYFENKDQIGVFLCRTGGVLETDTDLLMYHTTSYYRNLMAEYTAQNEEWVFFVSYTGALIVPSVYDNNSTLEGNLDCYAYSPYIRTESGEYDDVIFDDITMVPLVNGRDVMWAVGYDPDYPTEDNEDKNVDILVEAETPLNITLKFKRAMTKIDFEFSLKSEQTGVTVDSIILATTDPDKQQLYEGARIDGRNGDVIEDGYQYADTVKIASLLAIDSSPNNTSTHEAVLIPFTIEEDEITGTGCVEVMLVINGQRTYNSLPLRAMELLRGNSYTMKIVIDNFLKISTSQGLQLNDLWKGEQEEIKI